MKATIFPKAQDGASKVFDGTRIALEAPSVVQLAIGPEQVLRFDRDGSDLILVLKDGTRLIIADFFVQDADGRNDLVFEDGNGVTWWAQYGEEWEGFDIAEIEDALLIPPLPLAALAGLGALAVGAALVSGNDDPDSDTPAPNDPPVGEDASVTTPEDTPVSGTVTATDVDGDDLTFTLDGGPSNGTVTVNPDGSYEYVPNADYNGGDSFTVTVDDGQGGTDTITVNVTVTPENDPATITGDATGSVVEAGGVSNAAAGTPTAGGTLTVNDVDSGEAVFQTPADLQGTYGSFSFDAATGAWTYVLDNDLAATQALTDGEIVTDRLTVDSLDGTASETIVVTVTGTNDVPVVTDDSGQATEDFDGGAGVLSTTGQVTITDVDAGEDRFDTGSLAFGGASHGGAALGTLIVDAAGNWTYEVDNTLPEVQSLALGESFTESWQVTSADGSTTSTITVTINGTNDDPVIKGVATGAVSEDLALSATGQLSQDDVDTSNTHVWTVEGSTGDYGTLTVDSTGQWHYALDNAHPDVQALPLGGTLTEEITVRVTDNDGGFDEQVVTITINGTNDVPEISAGSDLSATITELADGDPAENTLDHVETGTLQVSGLDATDTHTVTAAPQGAGYLGTFTPGGLDPVTEEVIWTFTVNDADLDTLPAGTVLTQDYEVTVEDSLGASHTVTVTVTINGSNDRPDAQDDATLVVAGADAMLDVVANDSDVDSGETATLTVTEVDGQAITAGGSITLSGGRGTVSMAADGTLTFVPGPNAPAELILPYTVDDGSGTANATTTADWVINSAGVDITDDASPAGATLPDNVLSSVDDLTQVAIDGQAAVGGQITGLTISDGTNSVTVPAGSIVVQPDGSYSVTADLSGLDDGTLTVTADVEDAAGNTVTTTDSILKDTVTTVTIDPVLVEDGVAPVITGTGEPGASVTLDVDGTQFSAMVQPDGTWSVPLPGPLATGETVLSASAVDAYGNTDTDGRTVTGLEISDTVPGQPEDILVAESGLTGGTAEGTGTDTTSATFVLGTSASPLASIVIGGTVSGGALSGGTTVTLAELQNAATTPVDVATQYGTLSITGYDAATGEISYSYTLTGSTPDHSDSAANDIIRETIQIAAVESDGDIRVDSLVAGVEDDAPMTPAPDTPVSVVEGGAAVGTANGGDNLLSNDTLGADGGRVHEITYTDASGNSASVLIPQGGTELVITQYGSLTVASDGTWSYTPDASADHVKLTNDTELSDDFSYTTIDGDDDVSPGSATQQITVTDTVPVLGTPQDASLDEQHLANGSSPDTALREVSGTLDLTPGQDDVNVTFTTDSPPSGLSSGGVDLVYEVSTDGQTLTATKGAGGDTVFVVTLTDPTSAAAGYTFDLRGPLDHDGAADLDLTFGVEARDSDDDTALADFTVTVVDDAPVTTLTVEVDEDSLAGNPANSFTLSADMTASNTTVTEGGAAPVSSTTWPDGSVDHVFTNGTVTVGATGVITYVPEPNFSGTQDFVFTTDDDGVTASSAVTINVAPVADAPTLSVDDENINTPEDTAVALGLEAPIITDDGTGPGNNATAERIGEITLTGLPEGATLSWGGGSPHVVDASGSVTITLSDAALVDSASGELSMTGAQFEGMTVTPPAHASENFEVTYSVTSYEVDGTGTILPGVPGATSSETVAVYVEAVTDPVALEFNAADASTVANADAIVYTGTAQAELTLKEDTTVDISAILTSSFADLDGSEVRSFTVTNGSGTDIVVNGTTVAAGESFDIPAPGLTDDPTALPTIEIGGGPDFSGELNNITVALNSQDTDDDGHWNGSATVPGTTSGGESDSVNLNLNVTPVADDSTIPAADGGEDSAIAFLAGFAVTDTSDGTTTGGQEFVQELSFDVPAGWTLTTPPSAEVSVSTSGSTVTITNIMFGPGFFEAYLDTVTLTPPAHDSNDVTVPVTVTSQDTAWIDGAPVQDVRSTVHDVAVTVNPVAETVGTDTDGDGTDDLTMNGDFDYTTPGQEDVWFDLNSDGFDLGADWSNQDSGEQTFARLTPELIHGDGSQADAIGSQFQWFDGSTWHQAIFDGTPVDVPMEYLDTLQFRAAENFSGQFRIGVQAHTVDPDDDGTGSTVEATSGQSYLTNILISPVADEVTMSLTARTQGYEDTEIPLVIRPRSSDPSETFNVTIEGIPAGATLTYDGMPVTVTGDVATFLDFDPSLPLLLTPPPHSNDDFTLNITAQSVDELDVGGTVIQNVSPPITLPMDIAVKGVADEADVDVTVTPQTYVEADLDGNSDTVTLGDLVSASSPDTDGSETLTLQVTGLPEGFDLSQGTLLTGPDKTGSDRVWIIKDTEIGSTEITVPENFAGQVDFEVVPVTTENDGDSRTDGATEVSFTVTPSPEATITPGAEIVEDVLQPINLGIVHQNGDTDEVLDGVRISVSDAENGDFTLYLGAPGSEVPLSAAGLTVVTEGGVDYYELTGAQAGQLSAQGGAHLDGSLGGFDLQYRITDPGDGSVTPVTGNWIDGRFELTATPVSDAPALTIVSIDSVPGDRVTVDTSNDQVTVNLNIDNPDHDGSEHLVRVILEDVPEGVTVDGGELLGGGTWLLTYEEVDALPINAAGGLDLPVTFTVGYGAAGLTDAPISVTVQTQDRGDQAGSATDVLSDTAQWFLTTTFPPGGGEEPPASIETWDYTGAEATEDTSFLLSDIVDAEVAAQTTSPNILTVTIVDLPAGTQVDGMVRTVIDGQEVWTASVTTASGDDAAEVQAKLDTLMDSIEITPPQNGNDNNLAEPFEVNATLTTAVAGSGRSEAETTIAPTVPVNPVTDIAAIDIALGASDADGKVTESDTDIPLTITVTNPADGSAGSTVTGDLYLQIGGTSGLENGTLSQGGTALVPQTVTGVDGITDGTYYVVPGVAMNGPQDLVFTPDNMAAGDVTFDAWIRNVETDAVATTSTGTATIPVEMSNDGVTLSPTGPLTGAEAADSSTNALIGLDLSLVLNDADGSEDILTVLLSNLPEGFLLYTGASASDASLAELAINAGGSGGVNNWVLASGGSALPPYVGILPPQNWSGTLDDLELSVTSGETALSDTRVDVLPIGDITITPVANGLTLTGTNSFGREGTIVALNLNASMVDSEDASVTAAADESIETTTLEIKGLGEFASFYTGTTPLVSGISYDAASGTYTLTGLSQTDLDNLGFIQARDALTDQDSGTAGVQIDVTAHTVESGNAGAVSADTGTTLTVNLGQQSPTTGDNSLIWTGSAINGKAGEDTVHLRGGESLTGAELGTQLSNVETLDLGVAGANAITDLTPEQVRAMTDGDNLLTVRGSAEDTLSLSGDWTDNGDGTFTGTSAGEPDVTLTVEDVTVAPLPSPFAAASMMSFGFGGGTEGFGLASLDEGKLADRPDEEPETLRLGDLMAPVREEEDLTAGLPEETSDDGAQPQGDDVLIGQPVPGRVLEDELQSGAYEV
jgi:large repetitive protein